MSDNPYLGKVSGDAPLEVGDHVTIEGYYVAVRNPARQWWHFWKPPLVAGPDLKTFIVTDPFA